MISPKDINYEIVESLLKLDTPYSVFPSVLYNKDILYGGFDSSKPESYLQTLDKKVYDRFKRNESNIDEIPETLAHALHDFSIRVAKRELLDNYDERRVVAIMGGHNISRLEPRYFQIAQLSKALTESKFLMVSGGGPGAMEATHLGAWFAGKSTEDLQCAIDIMSVAPRYNDELWLSSAFQVFNKYPSTEYISLSIPTWFYGHEPPTPFATHIAKLFENSLREESLLAIAKGGVIYAPGSAGTMQEIFQDLAQNHYESYGYVSPMIFMGKAYWTEDFPIYPLIKTLVEENKLNSEIELSIFDDNQSVIELLTNKMKI